MQAIFEAVVAEMKATFDVENSCHIFIFELRNAEIPNIFPLENRVYIQFGNIEMQAIFHLKITKMHAKTSFVTYEDASH